MVGKTNIYADSLSKGDFERFFKHAKENQLQLDDEPEIILEEIWPPSKIWIISKPNKSAINFTGTKRKRRRDVQFEEYAVSLSKRPTVYFERIVESLKGTGYQNMDPIQQIYY